MKLDIHDIHHVCVAGVGIHAGVVPGALAQVAAVVDAGPGGALQTQESIT